MKTYLTIAAGAITAIGLSTAAQAATFDFSFYTQERHSPCGETGCAPEDYTLAGSGTFSYDGDAEIGSYRVGDLSGVEMSFDLEGSIFDEDDPRFFFSGPVALDVFSVDGELRAVFSDFGPIFDNLRVVEAEPLIQIPFNCTFGNFSILNDEGDCLNFGRGLAVTRVSEGEEPALGFFSMIPDLEIEEQRLVQAADEPIFGRYIGRLSDDTAAVPLPASLPLLAFAIGGMGYLRSRRG